MHATLRTIESIAARLAVTLILSATAVVSAAARRLHRPAAPPDTNRRRLMLVGTFYNDAWFDAHIAPLLACDSVEHITVVTDKALRPSPGVTYAIPSRTRTRIFGRTLARLLQVFGAARADRCDLLMGYHIMPNALICLIVARMLGRQCAYQMTGGPIQLIGGGVGSENTLLRRQRKSGRIRERLMQRLARQFDLVIVRGELGLRYMRSLGAEGRTAIIPAGIDTERFASAAPQRAEYELISVGRLVEVKRYDRLLRIVAELVGRRPNIGCAIVGEGPLRGELETLAAELGVSDNVRFMGRRNDVANLLPQARIFILTSASEGQSIAMMEAMSAELAVAAPDVGELTNLLREGGTGVVIDPEQYDTAATKLDALLDDDATLARMGANGRRIVTEFASTAAVAAKWSVALSGLSNDDASRRTARTNQSAKPEAPLTGAVAGSDR
ncbi:MAG TPA: glycosyltransferase [Phycisphaerae bacterium]|nr:glycosyltransferase [Phycisphaerae bacterium]HRW53567.1 glycosyltransferase [Phycisphaerae bacterium]